MGQLKKTKMYKKTRGGKPASRTAKTSPLSARKHRQWVDFTGILDSLKKISGGKNP